jgi:hypothetical protein
MVALKFLVLSVGVQIPVSLPNSLKPPYHGVAFLCFTVTLQERHCR